VPFLEIKPVQVDFRIGCITFYSLQNGKKIFVKIVYLRGKTGSISLVDIVIFPQKNNIFDDFHSYNAILNRNKCDIENQHLKLRRIK